MRAAPVQGIALLVASACATSPPHVAPPADGTRDEQIVTSADRCRRGECTRTVTIGPSVFELAFRAGEVSPSEASEGKVTRQEEFVDFANDVLSLTSIGRLSATIGIGTIRLTTQDSSTVWRCRMAWLDKEISKGWLDSETFRQREGLDCTGTTAPDSAPRWHVHRGMSVRGADVAALARHSGNQRPDPYDLMTLPVIVEPLPVETAERRTYTVKYERRLKDALKDRAYVWGVVRADGARIATYTVAVKGASTLQPAPDATPADLDLVRAVIAILRVPYRKTR